MQMPKNAVLFQVGDSAWTLGAVCLITAAVLLVVWIALLPRVARQFGEVRRLTSEEAATLSLVGHQTSYVKPRPIVHGPAVGKEWAYSFTIGDLREAWRQRHYLIFFGLPAHAATFGLSFAVAGFGIALLTQAPPFLLLSGAPLPIIGIYLFMMWAAIYTKLE
jgi:hypothetical protein